MLQETGYFMEISGKLPAISTGYRGIVLVVKSAWLVMLALVFFPAVFRLVTQRFSPPGEERCVTSLETAGKETILPLFPIP